MQISSVARQVMFTSPRWGFGLQRDLSVIATQSLVGHWMGAFCNTSLSSRRSRTSLRRRSFSLSTSSCGPAIRSSCSLSGYCYAIPCRATDAFGPTCSASKAQPLNLMQLVVLSGRWSLRCALHHGETQQCTSLPFLVSFIANIARKRPELNRDKTRFSRGGVLSYLL